MLSSTKIWKKIGKSQKHPLFISGISLKNPTKYKKIDVLDSILNNYPSSSIFIQLYFISSILTACNLRENAPISMSSFYASNIEVQCSNHGQWTFTRNDKEYTVGALFAATNEEYKLGIVPLYREIEDWETWHAIVVKRQKPDQAKYVIQQNPTNGSDFIHGLATKELTSEDLNRARKLGFSQMRLRRKFADLLQEQIYIDSKIIENSDGSKSIMNLYIEEINYITFYQMHQTSKNLQKLPQFKNELVNKMVELANKHDTYLVDLDKRNFLWNIERQQWMIHAADRSLILGRDELIEYLKKNKSILLNSSFLLQIAMQKDADETYKALDHNFFFQLIDGYQ